MAPTALASTSSGQSSPGRLRILVPEKVSPDGLALLSGDFDVDTRPGLSAAELVELIPSYHGLIVRSETRVTAAVLQAGRRLRVVARAGVGVDNIDVDAATRHGVIVVNSPAGNIVAAAEHTVALLLATARNIGRADRTFKQGQWERGKLVGVEVGRKTLGIIGLGKVGMKVARMCIGLGMKVLAVDPYASPALAKQAGVELIPGGLEELLPLVDFLTIHTPLLASTLDLLGEAEFQKMKNTARVLNVARGGVYNEAALLKALDQGWIAGAGLDVFTKEPPEPGSVAAELAEHEKVVSTPHLGASTVEAQENVSLDVCSQMLTILRGGLPTAAVNAPLILPEEYRKLQPYVKLVERMGALYTQHYASAGRNSGGLLGGTKFELVYEGELSGVSNTRPLFAALVKGLVSVITDSGGRDVNIVNATLIAKEKGIVINEVHERGSSDDGSSSGAYASLVTLRRGANRSGGQMIQGYVSGKNIYISKLGRFTSSFVPEGSLLILHNYDEPGKIGGVGLVLGKHGINIRFMQVASLEEEEESGPEGKEPDGGGAGLPALMILGVSGTVSRAVVEDLERSEGILDVSLVQLEG
ncbi:phosphoglycerate dehydrogenase [Microdochium trichocladiopsis]|uniref:D-3-phosphoglycerate dehydrogenase n=1 Tax=Microdochium trichocladiopsis TaxID=1682393 RepID=A0A9P8XWA2_9PEZI|nr:phosphoglycerate dehydrogenase [Microdochium trichocladiopsis]KAH7021081.1 phosphoglycerate dehydrogenase [Microdochium trichocladiopsis]